VNDLIKRLRLNASLAYGCKISDEAADRIDNQEFIIKCKDSRIEELETSLASRINACYNTEQVVIEKLHRIEELEAKIEDKITHSPSSN